MTDNNTPMTSTKIHYSPEYNLTLLGLEELHPFDASKAGKALALLRQQVGENLVAQHLVPVISEATPEALELAHSRGYLESLTQSVNVAAALELGALQDFPATAIDQHVLRPMRLAVQGTIDAAHSALQGGIGVNLAGGFHHASHDQGQGFCLYGDVIIALRLLQQEGALGAEARVLYVDLDAHQGNGVCRILQYYEMDHVLVLDMYNKDVFPNDGVAVKRIDYPVPLRSGIGDEKYIGALKAALPDAIGDTPPALVVYNAGTDILTGDPLGDLGVSAEGIGIRDRYVIDTCRDANVPLLIVPSGGYTQTSHRLIAEMLGYLIH